MTLRPIIPMKFLDIAQVPLSSTPPTTLWVSPRDLVVDENYQRNLSQRSVNLIRKLIANWDWTKFKAPNVNRVDNTLFVVDGQHTAIAAASRDDIAEIPVLVQEDLSTESSAKAFVGINKDRINVTPNQIFHAEIAAGNEEVLQIKSTLEEFGVTVLSQPRSSYYAGDTLAISTIKHLYNKRSFTQWKLIIETLSRCNLAPISADFFKTIDTLLWSKEYTDTINTRLLISVIRQHTVNEWSVLAYAVQVKNRIPGSKALTKVIHNEYVKTLKPI